MVFFLAIKLIPSDVLQESRARAEMQLRSVKPTSLVGALAIVLLWLSASTLVVWLIVRYEPFVRY